MVLGVGHVDLENNGDIIFKLLNHLVYKCWGRLTLDDNTGAGNSKM